MRLAHHPEALSALRDPTEDKPWRVLLSGCLAGLACGVDGTDYGLGAARPEWLKDPRVSTRSFCPEDHGLGTPRSMPDLHDGDGFAVLDGAAKVLDEHGIDLTATMIDASSAMLDYARSEGIDFAILTDRSAACGSQVISIGCRFDEPVHYEKGVGVATATLLRNGILVVSQRDPKTLGLLGGKLDPKYLPAAELVDFHRDQWVLTNLKND